jgi:hypothetical protein
MLDRNRGRVSELLAAMEGRLGHDLRTLAAH